MEEREGGSYEVGMDINAVQQTSFANLLSKLGVTTLRFFKQTTTGRQCLFSGCRLGVTDRDQVGL